MADIVGATGLQVLIDQFNAIYARVPNRVDLAQLLIIYRTIMSNYTVTAAQKTGLDGKLFAYEDKLRKIEAGVSAPTPTGTVVTTLPGQTITPVTGTPVTATEVVLFSFANPFNAAQKINITNKTAMGLGLLASAVAILSYVSGGGKGKRK